MKKIKEFLNNLIPNEKLNIKVSDIKLNHENKSYRLIFSCPDAKFGGVLKLNWENESKKLDHICRGDIRGLAFRGKDLYGLSEYQGMGFIGSNGFELIKPIEGKNLHGMIYLKEIDQFVMAETYSDALVFIDGSNYEEKKIKMERTWKRSAPH